MKLWNVLTALSVAAVFSLGSPTLARAADKAEADVEEVPPPDGCKWDWLCYKPPADEIVHPSLLESKFKTYAITVALGGFFTQWLVPDADKVAPNDDDMKLKLKSMVYPPLMIAAALIPAFCCMMTVVGIPIGYIGVICTYALFAFYTLWLSPITAIHLTNRTLMRGKNGGVTPAPKADGAPAATPAVPDATAKP